MSCRHRTLLALLALSLAACTPYAVHTSAQPLLKGESTSGTIFTVVPAGAKIDDTTRRAMPSIDWERRMGLDERGTRFGSREGGVSVELGVFYDRSALGMRKNDLVVVPSVAFHGLSLRRLFAGIVPHIPGTRTCPITTGCVRNR